MSSKRKRLKAELEAEYGVPVYSTWEKVPHHYATRSTLKDQGIIVPTKAKPDAIKNSYPTGYYFLFSTHKPQYQRPKAI